MVTSPSSSGTSFGLPSFDEPDRRIGGAKVDAAACRSHDLSSMLIGEPVCGDAADTQSGRDCRAQAANRPAPCDRRHALGTRSLRREIRAAKGDRPSASAPRGDPYPFRPIRAIDAAHKARPPGTYGQNPSEARRSDRRRSIAPTTLRRSPTPHKGDGSAAKVRAAALRVLKGRLAAGRATAERMLMEDGGGTACASRLSHLMDEIIRALYDFATTHVYPSKNASAGRTHGDRRGRRLRPRYAGARLRHRPSVRASLQADAVGRADRRIPALYAVGSRPEGRPRDPQRRRMHPAVAHRLHDPDVDPRGPLPVGRRGDLRRAYPAVRPRRGEEQRRRICAGQARRARRAPPQGWREPLSR